jgi:hypothetical protein
MPDMARPPLLFAAQAIFVGGTLEFNGKCVGFNTSARLTAGMRSNNIPQMHKFTNLLL